MFLKTNDLQCLLLYLDAFTDEEISYLYKQLNDMGKSMVFIQCEEVLEQKIPPQSLVLKETFQDKIFGPQKIIESAMDLTGFESYQMLVVSKSHQQLKPAINLPIGTVLYNKNPHILYEDIGHLPDLKVEEIEKIPQLFNLTTGYFSEIVTTYITQYKPLSNSGYVFRFFAQSEQTSVEMISAGRYFGPKHSLYESIQLSKRITKSKSETSQNNLFKSIYKPIIQFINEQNLVSGITRVPSRPEKADRLAPIVKMLSIELGFEDLSSNLICINNYPTHKNLGKEQRFINVRNQFKADLMEPLEHVVIIDDVFTTGATMLECAKTLYNAGVKKVTGVVLGVNQFADEFLDRYIVCENCGGRLHLRLNNKNRSAFYGCEHYHQHQCPTLSYGKGLNRMVTENSIKLANTLDKF
ncbi:ComF family protein [Bacillus subtilis]|jgi:predicted amidophosphoribosyltransferase|uniref:ComF family protein n=1 Tax=Bacillus TaxID=1386 RepID=UPI0022801862|nr:competence protein [Bacillus inaquosorum]MCY8855545.1 competence protein [Bacillus inaquosorum]